MRRAPGFMIAVLFALVMAPSVCTAQVTDVYRDPNMDFGSIQTVAVLPFANLARDQVVAERVRDVFINRLLASGAVYVLPVGEVARGLGKLEIQTPSAPTPEEVGITTACSLLGRVGIGEFYLMGTGAWQQRRLGQAAPRHEYCR